MNKQALVTGGSGFIGGHLVQSLLLEGWKVAVCARPKSILKLSHPNLSVVIYDGSLKGMQDILAASNPEIVFHLASCFIAEHASHQVDDLITANILFATHLAQAMSDAGVKKLINTGTKWQHFENQLYNPVNLYAATKQAFLDILKYYHKTQQLSVITLEFYDSYGPNDTRKKLFYALNEVAQTQKSLAMSAGEQPLDLVYIKDIVAAFKCAADLLDKSPTVFKSFSLSSGEPIKLKDLVKHYERIVKIHLNIQWGARPYRAREVFSLWQGESLPNWRPCYSLEEGLNDMLRSGYGCNNPPPSLPLISLIIPTYNRANYLKQTLDAVLEQTYPNLEIIISDNASPDDTSTLVKPYLSDPRVRYHRHSENIGMVNNWRYALENLARGDWFIIHSDDDYFIDPHYLMSVSELIQQHRRIVLVYADGYILHEPTQTKTLLSLPFDPVTSGREVYLSRSKIRPQDFTLCNVIYNTALAKELKAFQNPHNVACDTTLFLKSCLYGEVGVIKRPVSVYRVHDHNLIYTVFKDPQLMEGVLYDELLSPYQLEKTLNILTRKQRKLFLKTVIKPTTLDKLKFIRKHFPARYTEVRRTIKSQNPEIIRWF